MALLASLLLTTSMATTAFAMPVANLNCPASWQTNQQYQADEEVNFNGKIYTARWASLNDSPEPYQGDWQTWEYRNKDCLNGQRLAISDTAKQEMGTVLATIEQASLYRYQHDWYSLKNEAWYRAGAAQASQQLWPVIQWLIADKLNDSHGGVIPPSDGNFQQQLPTGKLLPGGQVGYIKIPEFASEDPQVMMAYAEQGHQLFRQNDGPNTCGWIVDLRGNWGGNSVPMMGALSPLFNDGRLAGVIDADGASQWLVLDKQTLKLDQQVFPVAINPYRLEKPQPPVAVLTGSDTASGAEFVVVTFNGRENTTRFGQPTYGASTMASAFPLSGGAGMMLSVADLLDVHGHTYGKSIEPHHVIPAADNAINAAKEWLTTLPACQTAP